MLTRRGEEGGLTGAAWRDWLIEREALALTMGWMMQQDRVLRQGRREGGKWLAGEEREKRMDL